MWFIFFILIKIINKKEKKREKKKKRNLNISKDIILKNIVIKKSVNISHLMCLIIFI